MCKLVEENANELVQTKLGTICEEISRILSTGQQNPSNLTEPIVNPDKQSQAKTKSNVVVPGSSADQDDNKHAAVADVDMTDLAAEPEHTILELDPDPEEEEESRELHRDVQAPAGLGSPQSGPTNLAGNSGNGVGEGIAEKPEQVIVLDD